MIWLRDGRAARYPRWRPRRCWRPRSIFGAVRMRQIDDIAAQAPRLKVGLVQPNFAYTVSGEFSRDEACAS